MNFDDIEKLLKSDPDRAVNELLAKVKHYYGEVPYILEAMRETPELLLQKIRYDTALNRQFRHIEPRVLELISIAVAATLRCEHCLRFHIRVAQRMGASRDEILDTILLAAALTNAAVLAEGTRAINDETTRDNHCNTDTCDVCEVTNNKD